MRKILLLLAVLCLFSSVSYARIFTADDDKESIARYTQTIEKNPDDSRAYWVRGSHYSSLGLDELALADFNKAIEINMRLASESADPTFKQSRDYIEVTGNSYGGIARIYKQRGNTDKAIEYYTKEIEICALMKPEAVDFAGLEITYANALTARAHIYIEQYKYDLAVADFTTAIDAFKTSKKSIPPFYVKERAEVYCLMGEYDKAIEDFNRSIIYNWFGAETICRRGDIYTIKGDYDKALEDYNTALHFKNFSSALMGRANVYAHCNQPEKAISDYSDAIHLYENYRNSIHLIVDNQRNDSSCTQAYYLRGKVYFEQGEYHKTIKDCDKAIKLSPHYREAQQLKENALAKLRLSDVSSFK